MVDSFSSCFPLTASHVHLLLRKESPFLLPTSDEVKWYRAETYIFPYSYCKKINLVLAETRTHGCSVIQGQIKVACVVYVPC